jgi:hypothetical protein
MSIRTASVATQTIGIKRHDHNRGKQSASRLGCRWVGLGDKNDVGDRMIDNALGLQSLPIGRCRYPHVHMATFDLSIQFQSFQF